MYAKYFKRLFDIVFSFIAIVILLPILMIIAVLVRINLGSPVIFKQHRAGKDGKIFTIYKFRSMTDERDKNGVLLPDEERLTKFGSMLRNLSLDELLEFFSILHGKMSVVGPRPLLAEYLPLYSEDQKKRHDVRPGLTGLAQVNGRNAMDWDTRLKYDLEYIQNITFMGDVKIMLKTVGTIFARKGISAANSVIIEPPSYKEGIVTESYVSGVTGNSNIVKEAHIEAVEASELSNV